MCYMTRQLFPSASQGALICAGGGEEGRLAAAPASFGAGRQDPAPHFGVWTRGFALSSGRLDPPGDPAPTGRDESAEGDGRSPLGSQNCGRGGLGVLCGPCAPAELPPTNARVWPGGSGGPAALRGEEGDTTSISSRGVRGGRVCCRVGLFVVVRNQETSKPLL